MTNSAPPIPSQPDTPSAGPLSDHHLAQLGAAKQASRRLRRTASIARASAWTSGVFGGITLLGVLFGDLTSLVLGAALLVIAIREGRLATRLTLLDPRAPRALALGQVALGVVVVVYSLWQTYHAMHSNGLSSANQPIGDPQVDAMLGDIGRQTKMLTIGFYACVALGGGAATGLMALYYHRRTAALRTFLAQTPAWVVQVMRTGA